ncbi:MAG: hypothetical protein RIE53_02640 [Rhodothermales bacterium]
MHFILKHARWFGMAGLLFLCGCGASSATLESSDPLEGVAATIGVILGAEGQPAYGAEIEGAGMLLETDSLAEGAIAVIYEWQIPEDGEYTFTARGENFREVGTAVAKVEGGKFVVRAMMIEIGTTLYFQTVGADSLKAVPNAYGPGKVKVEG